MPTAIYPGTFDPVTNGHLDIIQRSTSIFDTVVVAVAEESGKDTLFTLDERLEILKEVTSSFKGVYVESFSGLLVEFVRKKGANAIVRGLRAVSDFEYEMQMALMNKKLGEGIETVFFFTSTEYSFLSSSIVKQVAALGGCVKGLVPPNVEERLKAKYNIKK
ncbi:MAG: pantetheine-phosphate adenylyltransferase [Clostridia bacterium]|nr:pantetheine-phosphate adenylyltransferase [Clostridia bacterium]